LHKKYVILSMVLVFVFATGLSLGQTANNVSLENNITVDNNITSMESQTTLADENPANETVEGNESSDGKDAVASPTSEVPDLKYIWSVTGIEAGSINMALNQDGQELFGQAKYEPEDSQPWNAEVVGSIKGDNVELVLTAQKNKVLTTTKMSGIYANDGIKGNYTQVSKGEMVSKGTFSAEWISPDTSTYTPAIIEEPKTETPALAQDNTVATETTAENQTIVQKDPKSRFIDVRQYADKIGPGGDLSGIPPGMGGIGGLGGGD
jgi:hypothetical protein